MQYDLLIRGGQVLDPGAGVSGALDVCIAGGRIAALAPALDPRDAGRVLEADGAFVVPGLIDLHVHSYAGCTFWGVDLEPIAARTGVATAVDAGSAGGYNWASLR